MSLFRLPNLRHLASGIQRVRHRFTRRRERSVSESATRHLLIDPLEDRVLLSVSPGHVDDMLVNQSVVNLNFDAAAGVYVPATIAGQSLAADNDGDFVVTWTRREELYQQDPATGAPILDPITGQALPIIDPDTGMPMVDANIYARYFTDEVQRITLPDEVVQDNVAGSFGSVSLTYGGNEIQKLQITASYKPAFDPDDPFFGGIGLISFQEDLWGMFTLGFDLDRNGVISGGETTTIIYQETPPLGVSPGQHLRSAAATIQTALQGLGGELNDVIVEPISPHEFLIHFGAASMGQDQPELTVENVNFATGFLPAVVTSTVREPVLINNVPISPDDPALTARALEQTFAFQTSQDFLIGPIDFPPRDRIPDFPGLEGPYFVPQSMRAGAPSVSVEAVYGITNPDEQVLVFDANQPGPLTGAFQLKIGPWVTAAIQFDSSNVPAVAAAIEAELVAAGFAGVRVDATSWADPYRFEVAFPTDTLPPQIEYLPQAGPSALDAQVDVRFGNLDGQVFDVRYTGDAGKKNHPELKITAVTDDLGNSLISSTRIDMVTLKESSDEFRVNPEEPDNPITPLPDVIQQRNPAVAMDADGEFVIAWEEDVSDSVLFGSMSDIFARRFTPMGVVDPAEFAPGRVVPGVRSMAMPDTVDVQILTFDATGIPPLSGPFRLTIGEATTGTMQFDSSNLAGVATAIEEELIAAGYEDVTVAVASLGDPYQFEVSFGGASAGVDHPLIEYVADPATPLAANVFATDASPDQYTFRVNTFTTNAQFQPAVGMDEAGNFVIAWANLGQDLSYFNGIVAQRFDRHGNPLGGEWLVNAEDTSIHYDPYVGLSVDGHFAVSWTETDDANFLVDDPIISAINVEAYAPDGTTLLPQFNVGGAARSTLDFDLDNNFIVAWDEDIDADNIGITSEGVRARMYELYDNGGNVSGAVIRDTFRANSASLDPDNEVPMWPLNHWSGQVAVDADGDVVIAYDGFGADVAEMVDPVFSLRPNTPLDYLVFGQHLAEQINVTRNSDLLAFFDPALEFLPIDYYLSYHADANNSSFFPHEPSGDVTATIEEVLIRASTLGATDLQLGRLRVILDDAAGLVRGEANGILFSRWDAAAAPASLNNLFSDSVANSQRDGSNARYMIAIDQSVTGGDLTLRIVHPNRNGWDDVTFAANIDNNFFDPFDTADNIEAAIEGAVRTGVSWDDTPGVTYQGPVDVRYLYSGFFFGGDELTDREGTPWDLLWDDAFFPGFFAGIQPTDYVFEVTFQGEVHDTPMLMYVAPNGNNLTTDAVDEEQTLTFSVTSDGFFALSWFDPNNFNLVTTADIMFDSADPAATAAAIQTELDAAGFGGVQVGYTAGSAFEFVVTFAGNSGGTDQPTIFQGTPAGTPAMVGFVFATETTPGHDDSLRFPEVFEHTTGDPGTVQTDVSIGMEPDGDFVLAWTQYEEFTSGHGLGTSVGQVPGNPSNQNIYFRTFNEDTDTAGPRVTDLIAPDGMRVDPFGTVEGPVQQMVLIFDEDLTVFDDETLAWALAELKLAEDANQPVPANVRVILDSATNPKNYRLSQNGVDVPGGIVAIEFGMNRASELADAYGLDPIPSNKWEAVFTLDGNGLEAGLFPLGSGLYTIEALGPSTPRSGLRDKAGNPLGHTGFTIGGANFSRDFIVVVGTGNEVPVTEDPPVGSGLNGRTYPETPGAVAVDGDGDHIVAWTAYDPSLGHDRAFVRIYEANGVPAATNPVFFQATPSGTDPQFARDDQRFVTVASDQDGDFVVTWTNYRDQDGDGLNEEQDIYGRRFHANGTVAGEPFRVNTYTTNNQKWSNVAMDTDGDFVVTWSSYGQEDNQQLGYGYGVYARRYDSFGHPLAPESQVNITTTGHQQFSSVAMDKDGGFVVAWTSDQNGVGDDIIARSFHSDGSPQVSVLGGELMVNQTVVGNQRYPDVSVSLEGTQFVVTWSSSSQDGDGWGIFGRRILRPLGPDDQTVVYYSTTDVPLAIPDDPPQTGIVIATIDVVDDFPIADVNTSLDIITPESQDMQVFLVHVQTGTTVQLFELLPDQGPDFLGTELDDEATVFIAGPAASPAYVGPHVPEQSLSAFDGESTLGTWQLVIDDMRDNHLWNTDVVQQRLDAWSLRITVDLAAGPEFQVNTTITSDQLFSSVAMDYSGDFTVAWSGFGDQLGQEDTSENGVFYQRFESTGVRAGAESRVNSITDGNQWIPSIGSDADGNFVVAWTGVGVGPSVTEVYKMVSSATFPVMDFSGPLVTDVLDVGGERVLQDYVLSPEAPGIQQLVVVFNEDLSRQDGVLGRDSVLNPVNWSLERNGTQIPNGVSSIVFGRNPVSRKYEATVTFDGNGFNPGSSPLTPGDYVLTARDQITDGINALDGNYDGIPGTAPAGTGQDGFRFHFSVAAGAQLGAEFRINEETSFEQRFSASFGTGLAREETTRSLAVDHDGDFVVAWTSYGQDDPGNPSGAGVYFRMYDRNNDPIEDFFGDSGEKRVNTFTAGHQRNAAVAMDADGDFVIAWESQDQDPDGTWGIYAQRFDSVGTPIGGEFRVNSDLTGAANQQFNPAVAMDNAGNFVIVWATVGQNFSFFNDVHGQRYDYRGQAQGTEFRINEQFIPHQDTGVPGTEVNPTVGMDVTGNFVVAWDQVSLMDNGVVTDTIIQARMFDRTGGPSGANPGEFRVDDGGTDFLRDFGDHDPTVASQGGNDIQRSARNPQLVVDPAGNFIVVWESYHDNDVEDLPGADSYGIYFQRYLADGTSEMGQDHQANLVITTTTAGAQVPDPTVNSDRFAYDQVNPSIAMDVDGDYAIVWNGNGAEPFELNSQDPLLVGDRDLDGIFIRNFHADDNNPGSEEFVTVQSRVNRTDGGIQEFPSLAMEPDGDKIVVWSGNGVGDPRGIFARRYDEPTDTAGPLLTELRLTDGTRLDASQLTTASVSQMVVVFDEQMWTAGPDNVANPDNWVLTYGNGVVLQDAVASVTFGLNGATNKWEAVLTLDGNGAAPGVTPLPVGTYTITALHPIPDVPGTTADEGQSGMRDAVGNPIARTGLVPTGADMTLAFLVGPSGGDTSVTAGRTYPETPGAVAADGDGDHVVTWTAPDAAGLDRALFRLFDADGQAASPILSVTPNLPPGLPGAEFNDDEQRYAAVATDDDGDFIVTWTNFRDEDGQAGNGREQQDVYARRFSATGVALGQAFRVNSYTDDQQKWSSVAMDVDGDSVVTWSSYGQEDNGQLGLGFGVYARRYDSFGQPLGAEFRVNLTTAGDQQSASVDMDNQGNFIVAWTSGQNGVGDDVIVRLFNADGSPRVGTLGTELLANDAPHSGNQRYPDVELSPNSSHFVVTWTSSGQDGNGNGVYAQVFDVAFMEQQVQMPLLNSYNSTDVGMDFSFGNTIVSTLTVPDTDDFVMSDVNFRFEIRHGFTREVELRLISPNGTEVLLLEQVPRNLDLSSDFINTLLDDEAPVSIIDPTPGVIVAPFANPAGYQPENPLSLFDGENSVGTWQLIVQDIRFLPVPNTPGGPDTGGTLVSWGLDLERRPARLGEFRVNTTTTGDQMFSSVAMDNAGDFTIAWSGRGDQLWQEDESGYGVFYQQHDSVGTRLGGETRANRVVDGDQWLSSVAADGEGNFVIAWTGPVPAGPDTTIYKFDSSRVIPTVDQDGPIVTDVFLDDGTRLLDGDSLATNITRLVVAFDEELSTRDGAAGIDSVLNPANWVLQRNGTEISRPVLDVTFQRNPATRKYEALLTFDGNGLDTGTPALSDGNYVLTLRDSVTDAYRYEADDPPGGNRLDGDLDGFAGTNPSGTGYSGYRFHFSVASGPSLGPEFRINEVTFPDQRFSAADGIGRAREESTRSVAVDHDGDFAVVWTSYGQGDPNDSAGGDVYLRLYNRDNNPVTGEILVNSNHVVGHQRNAAVAMDPDGDLVVVWESEAHGPDGSYDVFARRFNALGQAVLSDTNRDGVIDFSDDNLPFQINTETRQDQYNSAVAMDNFGNFVVVWASKAGQDFSFFHDVNVQLYDYAGRAVGEEFRANSVNIPGVNTGPGSNEVNPAVAMDANGDFVVAWEQFTAQTNGTVTDAVIMARLFDRYGNSQVNPGTGSGEFQADTGPGTGGTDTERTSRNPQLVMDDLGNFLVVWESFMVTDYDVFYQLFDATGNALASAQVNQTPIDTVTGVLSTAFDGQQVNPSVAVDADGDFAIVWNGNGGQPDPFNPGNPLLAGDQDPTGVFIRHLHAGDVAQGIAPDFVTVQSRVNRTEGGTQQFPSIAMEPDGDRIVVWNGAGVGDQHGIFARRYNESSDTAGPLATELRMLDGTLLADGTIAAGPLARVVVVFDEEMSTAGGPSDPYSVLNPDNWTLVDGNGQPLQGHIFRIDFGLNQSAAMGLGPASNKWEAVVTFDGNGAAGGAGAFPLPVGYYELTVSEDTEDVMGNKLRHNGTILGSRSDLLENNPNDDLVRRTTLRLMVSASAPGVGMEFRINESPGYYQTISEVFDTGSAEEHNPRSMAMDHDGDFAVVWQSTGQDDPSDSDGRGVYVRMFDRNNEPLTGEILVNTTTVGDQWRPQIAMDSDGEFVVVWQAEGQDPDGTSGIYARRFSSVGRPLGGEFRVNSIYTGAQARPAAAMDDPGNFVVVWATQGQTFSYLNDVKGQRFNFEGQRLGSEFMVNSQNVPGAAGFETSPAVGMNGAGNFTVAWDQVTAQNLGQVTDTIVMARQYNPDGTPVAAEFQADGGAGQGGSGGVDRTARNPQVTVDEQGNSHIISEYYVGVPGAGGGYSTMLMEFGPTGGAGAGIVLPPLPIPLYGGIDYVNGSVAVDADGERVWVQNGHFAQLNPLDPTNPLLVTDQDQEGVWMMYINAASAPTGGFTRVNRTERGIQHFPTAAMEPDGDVLVVWSGIGAGDEHGIFARRYDDPTDTAGPMVTDFLFADGRRLPANAQVGELMDAIIVTFDEEMMNTGRDAATDPRNYRLLRDGLPLVGGIRAIQFGLDPDTNKWSAQLILDGNGAGAGIEPLAEGNYEIIASNSLRDVVGNPLGSTGLNANGTAFSRTFNVTTPTGSEIRVNDDLGGSQGIFFSELPAEAMPNSPQSVASDADGDYVAVFVSDAAGQEGVYAKLYDVIWTGIAGNRQIASTTAKQILVTSDPTASYASVSRDIDGDFVVTWSAYRSATDWDVYARRFDAAGNPLTGEFRVNSETPEAQRFSSVAMDADGDFVVVWQSYGQDDSGYGIYAQRYNAAAEPIGGYNEVQVLSFLDRPVGTFKLGFEGRVTQAIRYDGNAFDLAGEIEAKLGAIGADVDVAAISLTNIAVRFVGPQGMRDRDELIVVDPVLTGAPTPRITVTTQADGVTGEFRVNDEVANNQQFPAVDMGAEAEFIVTWTSFGQDGDAPSESNVYAKQFVGNRVFQQSDGEFGTRRYAQDSVSQVFPDIQYAVSTDDPANHIVPPRAGYDGVVQLGLLGFPMGSGLLLRTGRHILTAAHVVDAGGGVTWPWMDVTFDLPGGPTTMTATQMFIHPDWNGDMFNAADLAIIVLPRMAPQAAERYDIHRGGDELGHEMELVGYGIAGQGAEQFTDGLKRVEYNVFEVMGEAYDGLSFGDFGFPGMGMMNIPPGTLLSYDFDNGLPANDTFGVLFGINDLGLGIREGSGSHGDSGGGAFLNGKIIGVTSGGIEYRNTDVDALLTNVSFGVTAFYTRVSYYADWIDLVTEVSGPEFLVNTTTAGNQKWSSVALDLQGDFVVTWTSYGQDGVGSGTGPGAAGEEGVYAQRYDRTTGPSGAEFQVNTTADKQQQASHVAIDADGDFVVTWESYQDRSQSPDPDAPGSFGIYAQRYARNEMIGQDPFLGANGEIGSEMTINATTAGSQRHPAVAISDAGDYVILWSGSGQGDSQGVFHQRFNKRDDEAGPTVADVLNVIEVGGAPRFERVLDKAVLDLGVTQFVVTFGENLSTAGGDRGVQSVLNPANWKLTRDGEEIIGGIVSIEFGLSNNVPGLTNTLDAKYQAVLTFDADPGVAGNQPLERGDYVLTVRDSVEDLYGNALDGDYDGLPDRDFDRTFSILLGGPMPPGPGAPDRSDPETPVNSYVTPLQPLPSPGDQESPATASNAAGDYVIVWTSDGQAADLPGEKNIVGQRFDRFGNLIGAEFLVSSHTAGSQIDPAVAMDDFGNFVVSWSGQGEFDPSGVFARVFDAFGVALGDQFRVNVLAEFGQNEPSVAMDADGDLVVTWSSYAQDGDQTGVFARRYDAQGQPKGGEFQVNTHSALGQRASDVTMDDQGNFVVVWASEGQDGNSWGVYGQRFDTAGRRAGGEFRVNQHTPDDQLEPAVAMDAAGGFAVAWSSLLQDGSGYGVYARRFNAAGAALGGEFRVNIHTRLSQRMPDIGMDKAGDFVVTWSTLGQDDNPDDAVVLTDAGIFARMFNADGSDYVAESGGGPLGEFLVNITTQGDQVTPAIAVDSDGNFVIAWTGPDSDGTGIFARVVGVDPANYRSDSGGLGEQSTNWPSNPGGFVAIAGPDPGPGTLNLLGTPGNDTFEFTAGATPDAWVVKLNGVLQEVSASLGSVSFDGLGGEDSVIWTGSDGDETVELWPDRGVLSFGGYTVTVAGVESIIVEGLGGQDTATLHDSPGDDNFAAGPGGASLTGPASLNRVVGFETVVVLAEAGGYDVAKFYDSPEDDHFAAAPQYGKLYGPGFTMEAKSFNEVHAYATAGGTDVAKVYDSPGNDHFGANPIEASLWGDGYYNRIKFFEAVHAYANAGGIDEAKLTDSAGNDTLFASPVEASLYGDGFYNRAKNFDGVHAYAINGGVDEAKMYDSPEDDLLVTTPTFAALYGDGFYNRAMFFDSVQAYANEGGIDVAKMYDSPEDDTFDSDPTYGALYGPGFSNRATNFDGVHAYATDGGFDVANMFDSGQDDLYVGQPDASAMFLPGLYYNRAKGFEEVHAHADAGGTDRATLYDAVLDTGKSGNPAPGGDGVSGKVAWLYQFEEVFTASKNSEDDPVEQAIDEVFSAYWAEN